MKKFSTRTFLIGFFASQCLFFFLPFNIAVSILTVFVLFAIVVILLLGPCDNK